MPNDSTDRRLAREPIAIVGLASLFPKSPDLGAYWRNIVAAADCIDDVPPTHWEIGDFYDPDQDAPDKTYCKRGGFIPETPFNPVEFGLPPNILEVTDVLQLLSLVVARDLERDVAGAFDRSRTGVVLGVTGANQLTQPLSARLQTPVLKRVVRSCGLSERDADEIAEKYKKAFIPWEENSFPGMLGNVVAGRIANRFDLGGTNCTVDAACASSLAAPKLAISELVEGRADMMITGGCDAENTILMFMCFSKTPAFSSSGVIRPFDADADGTLIGEGIGLLALKRLADAERDGDRVYAVIRGIGSSSDGRFKSIYAPRPEGQMTALRRAYDDADCSPASVELFEAHATGTDVGDASELSSLSTVVREATDERGYAAVGSVKSQIGHTKGAAGAASLIKAALALHHRVLPPTINVRKPNPVLDDSPFYVGTETRPWVRDPGRPQRRAAVSAFGFGGTNFHAVLEEHGSRAPALHGARSYVWHAASADELRSLLERSPEGAPAASGESVAPGEPESGRVPAELDEPIPADHARLGFVTADAEEAGELRELALAQLREQPDADEWAHPKGVYYRRSGLPPDTRVAALFAGQGSQYVNMGRTAVAALPPLLDAFDEANSAFAAAAADGSLARAVFPPPAFDDGTRAANEERLRRTDHAQPAIGALSAGQYRFLRSLGFEAQGFLGHSFGELTALWAAGSMDDGDFFELAIARGRAMAPPDDDFDAGTMTVVHAPADQVRSMLDDHPGVRLCNLNAPEQQVVGGGTDAVGRLVAACAERGVRAQRIPVAAAFHTSHVAHAVERFGSDVSGVELRPPRGSVYANTPGAAYGEDVDANRRVLTEQLVQPVDFAGCVERLHADGFRVFVEFGPKGVLAQLVTSTLADRDAFVLAIDGGPGQDADIAIKQGAVRLAVLGLPLVGLNRHLREPLPTPPAKGLQVMLNGINHVSESRREEYQNALENGYQVPSNGVAPDGQGAATAAPPGDGAPSPNGQPSVAQQPAAPGAPHPPAEHLLEVAEQNLGLHSEYLAGQLDTASRLVSLVERSAADGGPDEGVTRGVEAVKEHGLAVGHAHERANEVLRDLVALELGATPDTITATAQRTDPTGTAADHLTIDADPAPTLGAPPAVLGPAPAPTDTTASTSAPPADPTTTGPPTTAGAPDAGATGNGAAPGSTAPTAGAAAADGSSAGASDSGGAGSGAAAGATDSGAAGNGAGGLDVETARSTLVELVAEKTGYPADMLEPTMDVEADLGIDSIKRLQIMGALRDRFTDLPEIGPESMAELRTLDDIAGLLAGGAQAPDGGTPPASAPASGAEPSDGGQPINGAGVSGAAPAAGGAHEQAVDAEGKVGDGPGRAAAEVRVFRGQARLAPLPPVERLVDAFAPDPVALIVDDGDPTCGALHEELREAGWRTHALALPGAGADALPSWDEDELSARLQALLGDDQRVDLVVVSAARAADGWDDAERRCRHALLVAKHTQRPLLDAAEKGRAAFLAVTRLDGACGHRGATAPTAVLGGVAGLVKTLALEAPELFCRAVDLAPDLDAATAARLVVDEANDAGTDVLEVAHDGERRQTVTLTSDTPADDGPDVAPSGQDRAATAGDGRGVAAPGAGDVLVVTGGGRGVTAECAIGLARRYRCTLLLLGRTSPGDEPEWAAGQDGPALKAAITKHLRGTGERVKPMDVERLYRGIVSGREVRSTVEAVREAGAEAEYLPVDIADEAATTQALAPFANRITGVVHGAGAVADRNLADKRPDDVLAVFAPKLRGLRHVLTALPADRLRHLVLFSSVAGFFGNTGQSDYAMANEALNRLARAWKRERQDRRVTALNWGAWAGGMVTPELAAMFEERGVELIPVEVGVRMLVEQFAPERAHDVVTVIAPGDGVPSSTTIGGSGGTWSTTIPAGPLSPRPSASLPAGGVRTERSIADLAAEPVLDAHRIGGQIVLPATVALGWCVNTAERLAGRTAVECRDFRVLGGVVFDAMDDDRLRLHANQIDEDAVGLTVHGGGEPQRPHYSATIVLDGRPREEAPRVDLPAAGDTAGGGGVVGGGGAAGGGGPADGADPAGDGDPPGGTGSAQGGDGKELYEIGTLFHGPALQGIRRVLQSDCDRMVFECRLPDHELAAGAYAGRRYSPVLSDLLLQAPLVAVRRTKCLASLPVGVGRVELYERLPDDEPFLVVVDDIRASDGTVTSTVTACAAPRPVEGDTAPRPVEGDTAPRPVEGATAAGGAVLARFVDVTVVPSAELAEKFAGG